MDIEFSSNLKQYAVILNHGTLYVATKKGVSGQLFSSSYLQRHKLPKNESETLKLSSKTQF